MSGRISIVGSAITDSDHGITATVEQRIDPFANKMLRFIREAYSTA